MVNKKRKSWTYEKDMEIIKLFNEGKTIKFLSQYFGVTYNAISSRLSTFREFGYINDPVASQSSLSRETIAEMKDAVSRFDTIANIPFEWKSDWAERNRKNLTQIGHELSKLYKEERGGTK